MSRMDNLKTFCAFSIIYLFKMKNLNLLETLGSQVELDVKQNNNKNGDFYCVFFKVNNLLVLFTICCTGPKW